MAAAISTAQSRYYGEAYKQRHVKASGFNPRYGRPPPEESRSDDRWDALQHLSPLRGLVDALSLVLGLKSEAIACRRIRD